MRAFGYTATRTDDGTLVIHDVPIFAECERGDVVFDADWIAAAVKKARQAEREGYMPPLHIRHHEPSTEASDSVRAAGYFRVSGAAPITYRGKQRLAVLADLYITSPQAQEEVMGKRLPYRSVEIFNVEKPALDSLALLDHEAPFLELPMLMVTNVRGGVADTAVANATFSRGWTMDATENTSPVIACFRAGSSAHLLFSEGGDMADKKNVEEVEVKQKNFADEPYDKKDDESEDMAEGPTLDVESVCKAIESGEISVADMDKIMAAIAAQKGVEVEEEQPAPAAVPGGESMKASTKSSVEFAKLTGEIAALRAESESRKLAEVRRADVADAMKTLADKPLGADLEQKLVTFHQEHGAEAFKAHVDSMAATFASLGIDNDSAQRFVAHDKAIPEIAMKYQDKGAEAVERAARFAAEWRELHQGGYTRMSEDRYVSLNMEQFNG